MPIKHPNVSANLTMDSTLESVYILKSCFATLHDSKIISGLSSEASLVMNFSVQATTF